MDPFKAFLVFLPSHLMIKASSDTHSVRTWPTHLTSAQGLYFFSLTVEDKQTQHDPKVNFQLKPKVRIKANASMQPRWLTLTWQERGGRSLPMMLTHQRSDCGNFFPELLASLRCPRLHLLLLRQPCSKKTTDAMQDAMFLGLKYQFSLKCRVLGGIFSEIWWNVPEISREQVLISPLLLILSEHTGLSHLSFSEL